MPRTLPWEASTPATLAPPPQPLAPGIEIPGLPPFAPHRQEPFFPYVQPNMEPEDHVQWNTSFSSEATTSTEATEASAWEKLIFQDETGLVRHDGLPATEPAIQGPDRPSTGPSGFQRAERVSRKTRIEIHALYRLGDRSIRELARLFSLSRSTVQHILAHPSTPRHTRQSHGYDNHPIKFQVLDFITTGGAFARRMALEEIPEHLGLSISERTSTEDPSF